jgi:hypothetical protein
MISDFQQRGAILRGFQLEWLVESESEPIWSFPDEAEEEIK